MTPWNEFSKFEEWWTLGTEITCNMKELPRGIEKFSYLILVVSGVCNILQILQVVPLGVAHCSVHKLYFNAKEEVCMRDNINISVNWSPFYDLTSTAARQFHGGKWGAGKPRRGKALCERGALSLDHLLSIFIWSYSELQTYFSSYAAAYA